MKAKILSLKGIEFEGDIQSLNLKTRVGEITVLPHHHPLMTILEKGTARLVTTQGEKKNIPVASGFLEVDKQNNLTVLIN